MLLSASVARERSARSVSASVAFASASPCVTLTKAEGASRIVSIDRAGALPVVPRVFATIEISFVSSPIESPASAVVE